MGSVPQAFKGCSRGVLIRIVEHIVNGCEDSLRGKREIRLPMKQDACDVTTQRFPSSSSAAAVVCYQPQR